MSENTDTNQFAEIACSLDPMFERALRAEKLAESNGKLAHDAAIKNRDLERHLDEATKTLATSALKYVDGIHDASKQASAAKKERDEARQQRDRLAEALRDIKDRCTDATIMLHPDADAKGCVDDCLEWSEQALAALNQPGETKP
jgi:chromosome segregation ATPase